MQRGRVEKDVCAQPMEEDKCMLRGGGTCVEVCGELYHGCVSVGCVWGEVG